MKRQQQTIAAWGCVTALIMSLLAPEGSILEAKKKKPKLSKKKISISVGKSKTIKVKNGKGYKVSWKSKKKKLVSVKKKGKYSARIKAKKAGSAKVIATLKRGKKRYKLTCKVKVLEETRAIRERRRIPIIRGQRRRQHQQRRR